MNIKQEKFITEYLKTGNATQSAINVGYSKKTAYSQGQRLLKKEEIKNVISKIQEENQKKSIAEINEILELWTNIIRSNNDKISIKDKLKASEYLAKRYGLLDYNQLENDKYQPIIICGENELED